MKLISCVLILFLIQMHNARRKSARSNGIRIPLRKTNPKLKSAHARGKILLDDTYYSYFGSVSIGTPKQQFDVIFDTGSTDFYVLSKEYETCAENYKEAAKGVLYNRAASSTYRQPNKLPKPQAIEFAIAWVFGFRAKDVIEIGNDTVQAEFLEVTRASEVSIAIMGMGYHPTEGNIVSKICNASKGEQKFSMYLPRNKGREYGELFLCGTDQDKYHLNTIKYVNELNPGDWYFRVIKVEIILPGKQPRIISENAKGIADTGSNRIVVPSHAYRVLLNESKSFFYGRNKSIQQINCDDVSRLPVLDLTIGNGVKLSLTGKDYIFKHVYHPGYICFFPFREDSDERWIFGESFFSKYYTIFDMARHRIGFAESTAEDF